MLAAVLGFVGVVGVWSLVLQAESATASPSLQSATAEPAQATPATLPTDALDGPGLGLDLLVKLAAVLGLAYVSLALLKRYTYGSAGSQRGNALRVIESTVLAPNRAVYLVRAGDREILLGVTPTQITPLSEWHTDSSPAAIPPAVRDHIDSLPR